MTPDRALRCPRCLGRLTSAGPSLLACAQCGPYPVLQGVPVLVPDPAAWCGRFYDAILAAMAEQGDVEHHEVVLVQRFAEAAAQTREPFGDDWTPHELHRQPPPLPTSARAKKWVAGLLAEPGPAAWLDARIAPCALAVEVGCGAGARTRVLAERCERVVVGDLSLRAVLTAREDDHVQAVVMDAQALPFAARSVDLLVAENVVDLLDAPEAFLDGVRRVLRPSGQALLSTPDPALGTDDERALEALLAEAGLRVDEVARSLPWLRVNSRRFVELYFSDALSLSRGTGAR